MLRQFGAMYLILGTCIAAGMLGLPVVTAEGNYLLTVIMILTAWLMMSVGAWCLLQVNLWLPPGANLISMAQATLGSIVRVITWAVYLLLLYSLICAYLAATSDVLRALLGGIHVHIPHFAATVLSALVMGAIVYRGMRSVDLVNRWLMSIKLAICILLIVLVAPHTHLDHLAAGHMKWHGSVWLVIVCSFGYAIILPSIRVYLQSNKKQLSRVVWIGSIIPMLLYLIWVAVIQGSLPRYGAHGLAALNHSAQTNSLLMKYLADLTHYPILKSISVLFISICSITGLLGVSICLTDFLADGFGKSKQGWTTLWLVMLTFTPPVVIVVVKPSIFISALAYAGLCCLYVLVALPVAMYLFGRRKKSFDLY